MSILIIDVQKTGREALMSSVETLGISKKSRIFRLKVEFLVSIYKETFSFPIVEAGFSDFSLQNGAGRRGLGLSPANLSVGTLINCPHLP